MTPDHFHCIRLTCPVTTALPIRVQCLKTSNMIDTSVHMDVTTEERKQNKMGMEMK
jgi:hypothetical protein